MRNVRIVEVSPECFEVQVERSFLFWRWWSPYITPWGLIDVPARFDTAQQARRFRDKLVRYSEFSPRVIE